MQMRSLLLLFIVFILYLVTALAIPTPGPSCAKIPRILESKVGTILESIDQKVCAQGCKPTVKQYKSGMRNQIAKPLIDKTTADLGVPQKSGVLLTVLDEIMDSILRDCGSKNNLCNAIQKNWSLKTYGACGAKQLPKVIGRHFSELAPLATEKMCKREVKYLNNPTLWTKVVPGYVRKYASSCKEL